MFEQSGRWNEYYRELEPKRRRDMLDALCGSEPDDGANEYRRRLFEARHMDTKAPGREVDRMLFMCVNFIQLCQSARWFKKSTAREVRRSLEALRFLEADAYGDAGARALYWEIRNAAARYISTCAGPGYNRGLFGLTPSRDSSRQERICKDMWQMSAGLSRNTGLKEELRLWDQAILDAYCLTCEDAGARFEAYEKKQTKA